MNSYNHITDRNEFIEKFRHDQGLSSLSRNETSKTLNRSRIISEPSVKECSEGRWDYLYSLERLKQAKFIELRRAKEISIIRKEKKDCTFSPKLNRPQTTKNPRDDNYAKIEIRQLLNIKQKKTSRTEGNILDRQEQWNYKRNMHIENIKNEQTVKEIKECLFKPKLNSPNALKKLEISKESKKVVVDPESYMMFVNRQENHRLNKSMSDNRQKSLPGSGNIWTNQITKPKQFNLRTDHSREKSLNIKSISKPLTPGKFNVKNNFIPGDSRIERINQKELIDLLYSQRSEEKYSHLENKNGLKFEDKIHLDFAMKSLHDELHSIDLLGYEG